MKLAMQVSMLILVIALVHTLPSHILHRRLKRGFKDHIGMGHGFGKRTEQPQIHGPTIGRHLADNRQLMSNAQFEQMMRSTPDLAHAVIGKFVDRNGDGYVSNAELFPERSGLGE